MHNKRGAAAFLGLKTAASLILFRGESTCAQKNAVVSTEQIVRESTSFSAKADLQFLKQTHTLWD
jgi:hypothetical protein